MKKICICTTVSITMKTFVVETAKYLHENCGYDITLICNEDEKFEKSLPEYLHFIPVHMARGIDLSALKSIKQFMQIFKEHSLIWCSIPLRMPLAMQALQLKERRFLSDYIVNGASVMLE